MDSLLKNPSTLNLTVRRVRFGIRTDVNTGAAGAPPPASVQPQPPVDSRTKTQSGGQGYPVGSG